MAERMAKQRKFCQNRQFFMSSLDSSVVACRSVNLTVRVRFPVGTSQTSFVSIKLKEVWQGRVKASKGGVGWGMCKRRM